MGMYRHKMPDREISKEMERANFWEAEADMWHQKYKEATDEIERLREALADIANIVNPYEDGDTMQEIARAALKEKE